MMIITFTIEKSGKGKWKVKKRSKQSDGFPSNLVGKKKLIKYKVMAYSTSKKPALPKYGALKIKGTPAPVMKKCGSKRYGNKK